MSFAGHPPDQAEGLLPGTHQPHEEGKPLHEEEGGERGEEEGERVTPVYHLTVCVASGPALYLAPLMNVGVTITLTFEGHEQITRGRVDGCCSFLLFLL